MMEAVPVLLAVSGLMGVAAFVAALVRLYCRILEPVFRLQGAIGTLGTEVPYRSAGLVLPEPLAVLSEAVDRAADRLRQGPEASASTPTGFGQQLTDVAHDLRTPLAALQLAIEEASACDDPGRSRALLAAALREATCMALLIENVRLASFFVASATACPRRDVSLEDLVDHAVTRVRPIARRLGVSVDLAVPDGTAELRCADSLVRQALDNLVLLAVFRGRPGGHVAVVVDHSPGWFRTSVTDDGPAPAILQVPDLGRIPRLDGNAPTGAALALAVAGETCRLHGWTLALEATEPWGMRASIAGPTGAGEGVPDVPHGGR